MSGFDVISRPSRFEVVEAREFHCGQMVRKLRADHQSAVIKLGVNTHRALRRAFDDSAYRRALLIDGRLAILGGVQGPAISGTGIVWLALTEESTRYPHHIVRICRSHLAEVLTVKRELSTFILPADVASLRFAKFMGFQTLRNSEVDSTECQMVPMVIFRKPKMPYVVQHADHASLH